MKLWVGLLCFVTFIAVGTAKSEGPDEGLNVETVPASLGKGGCLAGSHRAVTIEVDIPVWCGPDRIPGVHVDVMLTYLDAFDRINKTRIVVQNAMVMSLNGKPHCSPEGVVPPLALNSTMTVTLATSLTNTLEILRAKPLGRLSLVLLNPNLSNSTTKYKPGVDYYPGDEKREGLKKVTKSTCTIKGNTYTYVLDADRHWVKKSTSEESEE